jgi:hypothetical protein
MAELRTIFALLVLLESIKIEENWWSSALFVLLQQTESINLRFDSFNNACNSKTIQDYMIQCCCIVAIMCDLCEGFNLPENLALISFSVFKLER